MKRGEAATAKFRTEFAVPVRPKNGQINDTSIMNKLQNTDYYANQFWPSRLDAIGMGMRLLRRHRALALARVR